MKSHKYITVFAALALMLGCSSPSYATLIDANASFGFSATGGLVSYSPASPGLLINATTVSIPVPNITGNVGCGVGSGICEQVNSIAPTYLGLTNDFSGAGHTPLAVNQDVVFSTYTFDLSFNPLTFPTFSFTVQSSPSNRFTFVATSGSKATSTLGATDFLNVQYLGTFSDSGGTYNDGLASLSLTFTQTGGSTGTLNYTGTFATPPVAPGGTPEPATMAIMGSGLIGLGLIGRKRLIRK